MFIKLMGGVLVFVSCALIGYYYSLKDSFRINDLTELRKALLLLRTEIEYSRSGLPEALEGIGGRVSPEVGGLFKLTARRLSDGSGDGADSIWLEVINKKQPHTYFEEDDMQCLAGLGAALGGADVRAQCESADMVIRYIDGAVTRLREGEAKGRRLYRSVGIIGGALITIALL